MVFFVAGVQKIPLDLYDAARVDGAGPWRGVPGGHAAGPAQRDRGGADASRSSSRSATSTSSGSPRGAGRATRPRCPSVLLYELGFEARRLGTASAIAVLLTVLILLVTIVIVRLGERGDPEASRMSSTPRAVHHPPGAHRVQHRRGLSRGVHRAARAERPERPGDRVHHPHRSHARQLRAGVDRRAASPRASSTAPSSRSSWSWSR